MEVEGAARGRWLMIAAGLAGLAAAGVLLWAVLSSVSGFPRYSPLRHFISQLADPINPLASRVNNAFVIGGLLAAVSMVACSLAARRPTSLWAARIGAGAGVSLCFVGLFDITAPVPHFGFAILMGALSLVACFLFARAMRDASRDAAAPASVKRGAFAIRTLVWLQLASLAAGLVYAVVVVARVGPDSLEQLLRLRPAQVWVRVGGSFVNPFSIAEWVLFGVVECLLISAAAAYLLGWSSRPPTVPTSRG